MKYRKIRFEVARVIARRMKVPSVRSKKVAQPYATEATIASKPIRLSQPV